MGGILWTREEDFLLTNCIKQHGEGKWRCIPQLSGLNRSRKSCRIRWMNYLRPNINRGKFSHDEVDLIIKLHRLLGNRWSLIAGRLPGRTSTDVKNYWNNHFRRKIKTEAKPSSRLHEKVEIVRPQASTFKLTPSLQQLLGFRPPEIMPRPILTVRESYLDETSGTQELMGVHDHGDDEEEDLYDSCFEACAKIYRQLFHELDDLNHDHDHQLVNDQQM